MPLAMCCSLCLLSVVFLLLASAAHSINVAPGDIDETCFNEPGRQFVPNRQKILLDTQDYRELTLLANTESRIWKSINFDGMETPAFVQQWRDNRMTDDCAHSFLACDPNNQPQDNWMMTQYINITDDGVDELIINMTFSTTSPLGSCSNCKQSFFVYSYETNVIDETGRVNKTFYGDIAARFFHTQNNVAKESADEVIPISSKGLYLAVVDTGSCTRITHISVFYYVCPYQVVNMVVYPETVSPSANSPDRTAVAKCIDNASPVSGSSNTQLQCEFGGQWDDSGISCSCDPGYEAIMEACEACLEGEYKFNQGNEECTGCPGNSNSTETGATSCDCISGHYRASSENVTVKCTAPPSAPLNVGTNLIDGTSVRISWSLPTDNGGRTDLSYNVTYSNDSFVGPMFSVATGTQYTLTGLTPLTEYIISVISVNGVSDQDPDTASRTTSITVTTTNRGPTPPREFDISTDTDTGTSSILNWKQPVNLYGTLTQYNILIASSNNSNLAEVVATTTDTMFDLSTLVIEEGEHYVWIQAVTENGMGELSPSVKYVRVDGEGATRDSSTLVVAIGVSIPAILILLLCVSIVVIVVVIVLRKNKIKYVVSATHPYPPNEGLELGNVNIIGKESSNRMYVDPRNYDSINQAFDEVGVREIPPKEISDLDEIGVGEFGLVYMGKWSLKNVNVAVKTLRGGATDEQRRNFLFEAQVMGQFHHRNVIKLYGIISRVDPVMIVMEYLENGSLDRYLQKHLDKLGVQRQMKLAYGVAVGMSYLAQIGFVHRDLAARNILVAKDETTRVADFGLAREMVENEYGVQKGGRIPVRWTAPEAISHRSFSTASDVWSFGVLLWEIMTYGETPYEGWDNYTVFSRLEEGQRLHQPRYCPDDIYQLMLNCWEKERSERPLFEAICGKLEILIDGKPKPKPKPKHLKVSPPPPPSPPSPAESLPVEELLKSISMLKYLEIFHRHNLYTVADCFELTEDDLEEMGITLGGHQYKIVKNIRIKQEELGTEHLYY